MGRLQTARLENFIRRWGSIKGPGSVLSETLGDVFPVLDLENLTPENQLTSGWQTFWGFITVVAVAAQQQGASLINPVNSGNIIVIDFMQVRVGTSTTFTVGSALPLFALTAGTTARDTRKPGAVGSARIGANSNVGGAETGLVFQLTGGVDREISLPHSLAVLGPGTQLAGVSTVVNNTVIVSFAGRVRLAEPSELSF